MRSPPNPQTRVYQAMGDAVRDQDPKAAPDNVQAILATRSYRANFPPAAVHKPTAFERHATAHHEAAHAIAAVLGLAATIELTLGENGGGECRNSGIEKLEDRIVFSLAGPIAEAKFYPRSIHKYTSGPCYDLLCARIAIDELNAAGGQLRWTYRSAAKRASALVDSNWTAIENVAIALNHSHALCDTDIRLFAACCPP